MNTDLFGVGIRSRSPIITAQRRVNVFYESAQDEDGRGFKVAILGTPGLEEMLDLGEGPVRALYVKGDYLYAVHGSSFYRIDGQWNATVKGSIVSSAGRCFIVDNGTQIMTVDGTDGYIYTIATDTFEPITDDAFPGATSVSWQDGFFIVTKPNSGRFHISASYDGLTWNALAFKNAESQPDDSVLVISDHGTVIVFGDLTTEFYANTGGDPVPFARIQGSNLEWGLAARGSIAKYENSLVGLFRNKMGQVVVAKIEGYEAFSISTSDLDAVIRGYPLVSDATAFSYMLDGHAFYQINFPSGGASWLYDGKMSTWSQVASGTAPMGRHRAELQVEFQRQTIVSDYENGKLYRLNPDVYTDDGAAIKRLLVSKHITNQGLPITIDELRFFFETGVGLTLGQGSDPELMLRYSKDGGQTWSPERRKKIGPIGRYGRRVKFEQLGQSEDFVLELSMSDPVKFVLAGEAIDAE